MFLLRLATPLLAILCLAEMSQQEAIRCKSTLKHQYDLCRSKLAKNKQEHLVCTWAYLKKFPSCYFKENGETKSCSGDILSSFSKCVMASKSFAEIIACNSKKEERRMLCQPTGLKREDEKAEKVVRGSQQANVCVGNYDRCVASAVTEGDYKNCFTIGQLCPVGRS